MLSRQEQQRLADIERRLRAAEPDLARELGKGPRKTLRQRLAVIFRKRPRSVR